MGRPSRSATTKFARGKSIAAGLLMLLLQGRSRAGASGTGEGGCQQEAHENTQLEEGVSVAPGDVGSLNVGLRNVASLHGRIRCGWPGGDGFRAGPTTGTRRGTPASPLRQCHQAPAGGAGFAKEVLWGAEPEPEDLLAFDRFQVVEDGVVRVRVVGLVRRVDIHQHTVSRHHPRGRVALFSGRSGRFHRGLTHRPLPSRLSFAFRCRQT
jgi:hypothetical protein